MSKKAFNRNNVNEYDTASLSDFETLTQAMNFFMFRKEGVSIATATDVNERMQVKTGVIRKVSAHYCGMRNKRGVTPEYFVNGQWVVFEGNQKDFNALPLITMVRFNRNVPTTATTTTTTTVKRIAKKKDFDLAVDSANNFTPKVKKMTKKEKKETVNAVLF